MEIDCLQCGNCCKTIKPVLITADIKKIADFLELSTAQVTKDYLEKYEDGDWIFNALPCPFLAPDNRCRIYAARPEDCREYPHTDKKGFATRTYGHASNSVVCPAAYYIVERMKERFGWRSKSG